jgi:hypothetical protein
VATKEREKKTEKQAAEQKGEHVGTEHEQAGVARMQHLALHAPIHKIGALPRPLVEPVEIVNRDEVKPDRARRRNGMPPSGHQRQHHVQLVNRNQPIHEADETQEKEVQRRDIQLAGDNWGMLGEDHCFVNEGYQTKYITNPYLWQMRGEVAGRHSFVCSRVHGN